MGLADRLRRLDSDHHENAVAIVLSGALLAGVSLASCIDNDGSTAHVGWDVGLTVVTGGLLVCVWRARGDGAHPRASAVTMAALLVANGALVQANAIFGFYVWSTYIHVHPHLRGRARVAAIPLIAAPVASAQVGGWPTSGGASWWVFLVVWAGNTLIAGVINGVAWNEDAKGKERERLLDELSATNQRLSDTLEENAALQQQLVVGAREAGVADERRRMAREIHDTLAQGLAGIITQLQAAQGAGPDDPRRAERVDTALMLARHSLTEARRSVQALRPEALERGRLADALTDVVERWRAVYPVPVDLRVTGDVEPLDADVEVALLRVAEEALGNAGRHAAPAHVAVTLSYLDDLVTLDIVDDGAGFDTTSPRPPCATSGFGLTTMSQRVVERGGTLAVESEPGEGTAVSATVPLARVPDRPDPSPARA